MLVSYIIESYITEEALKFYVEYLSNYDTIGVPSGIVVIDWGINP